MNELIKINENGLVDARELHEFLEVKKDFTDWFKYRVGQYEFEEEKDFTTILGRSTGGRPCKEFALTLETAKELSMVENNAKGKEARKYFISCEKKLKESVQAPLTGLSPQLQLFINMELEQKKIKEEVEATKQLTKGFKEELQGIRDVVAINSADWKNDCKSLVTKIATKLGGFNHIQDVYKEVYSTLEKRMGCQLSVRLTNKRRRMADEGVCKSKRDKLNYINVIEDDKKLIEGYIAITKEIAIKYGV